MRIAFLIEGATEAKIQPGAGESEPFPRRTAIQTLVARILGLPVEALNPWFPRLRGAGAGRILLKGALILEDAQGLAGCYGAVVLVDADGEAANRRQRLEKILGDLEQKNAPIVYRTAVGLAIEKFEAWLLADEPRLCEVLGIPNPAEPLPPPEKLPHRGERDPKRILRSRVKQAGEGLASFSELARRIVEQMDLDVVAERCPEGFGAFRDQVRQKLGPLFGR